MQLYTFVQYGTNEPFRIPVKLSALGGGTSASTSPSWLPSGTVSRWAGGLIAEMNQICIHVHKGSDYSSLVNATKKLL